MLRRLGLFASLSVALVPAEAGATEPPSCDPEVVYPDISGFYEVSGSCGIGWCAQVVEFIRWEETECAFSIGDGETACTFVTVTEEGDVLNPVVPIGFCSGLSCGDTTELPDGALRLEDCEWLESTDADGPPPVPCDALELTPVEGPLPEDNHPCRVDTGSTGADEGSGTAADETGPGATAGDSDPGTTSGAAASEDGGSTGSHGGSTSGATAEEDPGGEQGCDCRADDRPAPWWALLLPVLAIRRRSRVRSSGHRWARHSLASSSSSRAQGSVSWN